MRAKIIINPSSGKQIVQKSLADIISTLVLDNTLSGTNVFYTQKKDDAFNEAKKIKKGMYDLLIAVGGDGTLNEVVNGVIESNSEVPIAIVPAGTVNDFSTFLAIPKDVTSFCQMIRDYTIVNVDVGKVKDKYFINVAAAGLLTDIAYKVSVDAKTVMGKLAYYAQGVIDLPQQLFKSIDITINSEEINFEQKEALMFIVTNTPSVGGFKKLAPKAKINDNKLDVFIIHKPELGKAITLFVQILKGEHINNPDVTYFQTKKLDISCKNINNFYIDIDGEQGCNLPVTIEAIPHAVKFLIPKNSSCINQ